VVCIWLVTHKNTWRVFCITYLVIDDVNLCLAEPAPPKPDQWLEIVSPFIGYRPPLNVVDKPMSAALSAGGSMELNEIEEEAEEGG